MQVNAAFLSHFSLIYKVLRRTGTSGQNPRKRVEYFAAWEERDWDRNR
jgi:hypothetical protein